MKSQGPCEANESPRVPPLPCRVPTGALCPSRMSRGPWQVTGQAEGRCQLTVTRHIPTAKPHIHAWPPWGQAPIWAGAMGGQTRGPTKQAGGRALATWRGEREAASPPEASLAASLPQRPWPTSRNQRTLSSHGDVLRSNSLKAARACGGSELSCAQRRECTQCHGLYTYHPTGRFCVTCIFYN